MKWVLVLLAALAASWNARQESARAAPGFAWVDLYVDAAGEPLAAWQLDLRATRGRVRIVGVEGGAAPFDDAPFYDPAAMREDRVVVAGFSTAPADRLPTGRVRVARVHVEVLAGEPPRYRLRLQTAAGFGGTKRRLAATLEEGRPK